VSSFFIVNAPWSHLRIRARSKSVTASGARGNKQLVIKRESHLRTLTVNAASAPANAHTGDKPRTPPRTAGTTGSGNAGESLAWLDPRRAVAS
jgi:hypothetical protein